MGPTNRRHCLLELVLALLLPAFGCTGSGDDSGAGQTGSEVARAVATVTRVVGPGGLRMEGSPPGSFLGAGAELSAGKALSLPHGTVALLALGKIALHLNEDSALTFDDSGEALSLQRGELLVRVPRGAGGLEVRTGDDVLHVGAGEMRIVRQGAGGQYTSLDGRTRLVSGSREVILDAGMQVRTPLSGGEAQRPTASVRVLEGADWARILDHVEQQASEIPAGVGSLSAREAGSKFEFQPLSVGEQRVEVSIAGHIAQTRVQQRFDNASSKVLEGIYRFPLPPDATISGLELLVGTRWMRAEMVEKKRAAQIFQQIVDATIPRDPALLEWDRGSEFKMRIFPIPARGARAVRISYTQVLRADGGVLRYRYPMAGSGSGASGAAIGNFQFDAHVATAGLSPEAEARLRVLSLDPERRSEGGTIHLHAEQRDFVPMRDLGLDLPLSEDEGAVHQEAMLGADGKAYFLLSLAPALPVDPAELGHTDYAFVLDRSHSTTPELWTLAGTLVQAMVDRMPEGDRYELLACDSACDRMHGSLRLAGPDAAPAIKRFIESQDLSGASDLGGGIAAAAGALNVGPYSDRQRVVIYLGDGIASAGELGPDRIVSALQPALDGVRVEALALGARADLLTLRAVAEAAAGDVTPVDVTDDPTLLARSLSLRVRYPALTGLSLSLPQQAYDVHPKQLPPLRPGQRIVVVGKLRGPLQGEARLHGGDFEQRFPLSLQAEAPTPGAPERHLGRTWAQRQIEQLTREQGDAARDEIVRLSITHTVMSRYTSLLALENDAMYREFGVDRRAKDSEGLDEGLDLDAYAARRAEDAEAAETAVEAEAPVELADEEALAEPAPMASAPSRPAPKPAAPAKKRKARSAARPKPRGMNDVFQGPPAAAAAPEADLLAGGEDDSSAGIGGLSSLRGRAGSGASAGAGMAAEKATDEGAAPETRAERIRRPFEQQPIPRPLPHRPPPRRRHRVQVVRPASPAGPRTLAKLESLRSARDAAPQKRSAHLDLVRTAIVAARPEAGAYAAAWVMADPDHLRALRALADTLASAGDPRAMRAYASAVEIVPTSKRYQRNIAAAHARRGELKRACAHRRALVSIAPADGEAQVALVHCLLDAGDHAAAKLALARASREAKSERDALRVLHGEIDRPWHGVAEHSYLHPSAQLRATLSWNDPEQKLDIGVVDSRGRRLSALFSDSLAVREAPGKQTVTLARLTGRVYLEVTRRDAPPTADADRYDPAGGQGQAPTAAPRTPIKATLVVEGYRKRSFPVTLTGGSVRVATLTPGWR